VDQELLLPQTSFFLLLQDAPERQISHPISAAEPYRMADAGSEDQCGLAGVLLWFFLGQTRKNAYHH